MASEGRQPAAERPMETRHGIAVSSGFTVREAFVLDTEEILIPQRFIEKERIDEEAQRFEQALRAAEQRLALEIEQLGPRILISTQILQIHKELLSDPVLRNEILTHIRTNQFTAEHAVARVMNKYIKRFQQMNSQILSERVHDLYDVEKLILSTLLGSRMATLDTLDREVVLIARNLTPAQAARLDPERVRGFATDIGGKTSHTAILAKALGIPAVVGLEDISTAVVGGDLVAIDGFKGIVIVNPDSRTQEQYRHKEQHLVRERQLLRKEVALPSETLDGYPIELLANVELLKEVHAVRQLGAAGIGLFRTEFIYLQNPRAGEEGHFQSYQAVMREMGDLPVTFRTFDLGADKAVEGHAAQPEENPFLGNRSLRYCFTHPDVFRAQLRAIFRVSVLGTARMMLPMVGSCEELDRALAVIGEVKAELTAEGIPYDERLPIGVMVEIPALALLADLIAERVDFFSVGTNDLTQYTLAVDRSNEHVAALYNPGHPALLRLMAFTLAAGERAGIPVSICGEMASEELYVPLLIGLGFRCLSISPTAVPEVKRIVRAVTVHGCQQLAQRCLDSSSVQRIQDELQSYLRQHLGPVRE